MTEAQFWQLIEDKIDRSDIAELDLSALEEELAQSSAERIMAFGHHFERFHQGSYKNRIWGAAYLMNGGCSDDGFDYFRGWLIGMGRDVYTRAMENADSLADLEAEDVECEDLLSVAYTAYETMTGDEMPQADDATDPVEDDDWDFEDDDAMRARFPRLWARHFPDEPDEPDEPDSDD